MSDYLIFVAHYEYHHLIMQVFLIIKMGDISIYFLLAIDMEIKSILLQYCKGKESCENLISSFQVIRFLHCNDNEHELFILIPSNTLLFTYIVCNDGSSRSIISCSFIQYFR